MHKALTNILQSRRIRVSLGLVLIILSLFNLAHILYIQNQHADDLQSIATLSSRHPVEVSESFTSVQAALNQRYLEMKTVNPDYVAWIRIDDTPINYPVMQTDDNHFYLDHNFKKQAHAYGSIFMDFRNQSEWKDSHIIVYGHAVNGQAMFGMLDQYKDRSYLDEHPKIRIYLNHQLLEYDIFSVQTVDANVYVFDHPQSIVDLSVLYESVKQASLYRIETSTLEISQMLTLVSCETTYENGRILIHAMLRQTNPERFINETD